jgi:predicted acetyltransferase
MEIAFTEMEESQIDTLTKIMTRAFDEDTRIHLGKEKGGPDGYDDGSFLRKWGFHPDSTAYCILVDGRLIGAVILWICENHHHFLGNLFLDPLFENRGIGTQVWKKIEKMYPDAISWSTETALFSRRNLHFYVNKCGFHVVEIENPKNELEGQYKFRKVMK